MELTLADVLTLGGTAASAALITGLVQVIKKVIPIVETRGWEQALALASSLILVVLAFVDQAIYTLNSGFLAFVAWLMIAKLATGIYDEVTRQPGAFTEPA
jgi:hypothetical protein